MRANLIERDYWVEFLGVELKVQIGIHEHEMNSPQIVNLDVKIMLSSGSQDKVFDYDVLESYLSNDVPLKKFDYQEDLARYIVEFLFDQVGVERVEIALRKPEAYPSCIVPAIRLVVEANG